MSKLVFFGTETFSAPTLQKLIVSDFEIAAVVTKPDAPRGRGRKLTPPLVKTIALANKIKVFQPTKLAEIADELRKINASAGVLVAYGKIIPQSIIDIFPHGIINVHPSLLPKYRGPSPIESAIANGDSETGISIMSLAKEMDAGPVFVQENLSLSGSETRPELYEKFSQIGANLLVENLPKILSGGLMATPQDDSLATYCKLLAKFDGALDPHHMTATECERKVRAYLGFPKTRLDFLGVNVIVTKAHATSSTERSPLSIPCADDSWLEIDELVAPSGKMMSAADFVRGRH